MPVWWYPFSSIRWSPASTRVALVGALGLERASALACSAMCYLLSRNNRPVDYYCQVVESKYSKCDRPTVSLDVIWPYRRERATRRNRLSDSIGEINGVIPSSLMDSAFTGRTGVSEPIERQGIRHRL